MSEATRKNLNRHMRSALKNRRAQQKFDEVFELLEEASWTAEEMAVLDAVTAGTVSASKALVVDADKTLDTLKLTSLQLAVTAVAAAGSTIGEGGNLVAGLNVVSAADNTKCVDLPTPVAGTVVIVSSQTAAKTLPVFPAVNTSIDNLAANAAKTIGAATATTGAVFVADNATHWVTVLGDTA